MLSSDVFSLWWRFPAQDARVAEWRSPSVTTMLAPFLELIRINRMLLETVKVEGIRHNDEDGLGNGGDRLEPQCARIFWYRFNDSCEAYWLIRMKSAIWKTSQGVLAASCRSVLCIYCTREWHSDIKSTIIWAGKQVFVRYKQSPSVRNLQRLRI